MRTNTIIIVSALVALFTLPATVHAEDPPTHLAPDLCEEPVYSVTGDVYMDLIGQTISRFCKPRINPPILDREVCCSIGTSASCKLPSSVGRCSTGMKFWCEFGEQIGSGVVCYQDGPNACDLGFCNGKPDGSGWTPLESTSWICCTPDDECTYVGEGGATPPAGSSCGGWLTTCNTGSTNEDGTVNCEGDE